MVISFVLVMTLVVVLVVKVDLSTYLLDDKTAELLYSDSAYSDNEEKIEHSRTVNEKEVIDKTISKRYDSPTFTKEFDKDSFTENMASEEATRMLEEIYRRGEMH